MDGHGIDGDRNPGIESFTDSRPTLRLEGDLAEAVFWPGASRFRVKEDEHAYPPFTFFRNFPNHLNVTTRRFSSIMSSPVAGFHPLRPFFSFTQNLPKPVTRTSLPDSRDALICSIRHSVT
jgi:hypothetical protein